MKNVFLFVLMATFLSSCFSDSASEQAEADDLLIREHIATSNLIMESTPEGVYYSLSNPGNAEHPNIGNTLDVNYKGYFLNGDVFDEGTNVSFPLSQVIEGWQVAIPLLGKGGTGTFIIPSGLAYGTTGQGPIGANTVLIFDVTLHDFQ